MKHMHNKKQIHDYLSKERDNRTMINEEFESIIKQLKDGVPAKS